MAKTKPMLSQIRELEKQGKITTQAHPSLPLIVCKYSREVMYSRDWDELTKKCRGLVVDVNTGEVVAEPFHKFFNYEELIQAEVPLNGNFRTMEKLDGSL